LERYELGIITTTTSRARHTPYLVVLALQGLVAGALFRSVSIENKYWKWRQDKKLAGILEPHKTKPRRLTSEPNLRRSRRVSGYHIRRTVTLAAVSQRRRSSAFAAPMQHRHTLLELTAPLPEETICEDLKHQLRHVGENTWRFSLFKNGYFVAYFLSFVLWKGSYYIPFTFLPDRGKLMGISSLDSSLLLSAIGISSIVGKILFGVICDIPTVQPHRILLYGLSFIVCGLAVSLSFAASLMAQITCAAIFGLFLGKFISRIPPLYNVFTGAVKLSG